LDKNSRLSLSKIAKKVGLSEQTIHYRFKNLKETIKFFPTILDFSKLGYSLHKACFRLKNMTPEKKDEIINYLKNHKNTFWVSSSDGQFELSAAFLGKTLMKISSYLNEFNDKFINHISEQKIVNILKGEFFFREYLTSTKSTNQRKLVSFGSTPQEKKLMKLIS
ncbi:MAG: winged helix-turn-helix transcriptional regulator, partial [Nanoarchaeota archaeon]|nr:winged helix-turn-helix transcriptional regulator [Nanoarchaeota archaeon]